MPNNPGQGRKPKPTVLKLLHGERNKNRINLNEPKPTPKAPKCPSWLSVEARREWKRLAPELERLGLLTKADLAMFASYCSAFGKLIWAERQIKKIRRHELKMIREAGKKRSEVPTHGGLISGGELVKDKDGKERRTGYKTRPYVWVYNKSLEQIRSFGAEFGLSPSTRTRIRTADLEDADDDLFTK